MAGRGVWMTLTGLAACGVFADAARPEVRRYGNVTVVALEGGWAEMGRGYGAALRAELWRTRETLMAYLKAEGVGYGGALEQADAFMARFPASWRQFVEGYAEGAGLPAGDARILHAMETLRKPLPASPAASAGLAACAFVYAPPGLCQASSGLIARNYDYGAPFAAIAQRLVVAVLRPDGRARSIALITMPGQAYCASCVNAAGVFMEMNNGMWSGGHWTNVSATSLLAQMADAMRTPAASSAAGALAAVRAGYTRHGADFSLIVNAGDATGSGSLEVSSNATLGAKPYVPHGSGTPAAFISTNFYQNASWGNAIPAPSDREALSVTRFRNLARQLAAVAPQSLTAHALQALMGVGINDGGAVWAETIYQLVYDTASGVLWARPQESAWTPIPLREIFMDRGL